MSEMKEPPFITVFTAVTYVSQTTAPCFCSARDLNSTARHIVARHGEESLHSYIDAGGTGSLAAFIALVSNGRDRFSGGARSQLSHHQRQRTGALLAQPGRRQAATRENPQAEIRTGLRAVDRPRRHPRQAAQFNGERPALRQVRFGIVLSDDTGDRSDEPLEMDININYGALSQNNELPKNSVRYVGTL